MASNNVAEKVADDIVLGPYKLIKKGMKVMAGQKSDDDMMGASSTEGGAVSAAVFVGLTPFIGLVAIILVIVYGFKLAKLAATRGLQGPKGKHLVSLGIAAPALLSVPFVNLGLAIWLAVAVADATK